MARFKLTVVDQVTGETMYAEETDCIIGACDAGDDNERAICACATNPVKIGATILTVYDVTRKVIATLPDDIKKAILQIECKKAGERNG